MRYPPALTIQVSSSRTYQAFALSLALLILISCAAFLRNQAFFSFASGLICILTATLVTGLMKNAFARAKGDLRFAQGQWTWLVEDLQIAGNFFVHLDLQDYVLVRFVPLESKGIAPFRSVKYFHFDRTDAQFRGNHAAWLALRRAIYSPRAAVETPAAAA